MRAGFDNFTGGVWGLNCVVMEKRDHGFLRWIMTYSGKKTPRGNTGIDIDQPKTHDAKSAIIQSLAAVPFATPLGRRTGLVFYFLPFLFFLPPPPPPPLDCPCAAGAPLPSLLAASTGGASSMASSAGGSGTPAIPRPSCPSDDCIRRDTSAALVVRYLSTTPLAGS